MIIVFTVSMIQLPPTKDTQYGLDQPSRYEKTKTKIKTMLHD